MIGLWNNIKEDDFRKTRLTAYEDVKRVDPSNLPHNLLIGLVI